MFTAYAFDFAVLGSARRIRPVLISGVLTLLLACSSPQGSEQSTSSDASSGSSGVNPTTGASVAPSTSGTNSTTAGSNSTHDGTSVAPSTGSSNSGATSSAHTGSSSSATASTGSSGASSSSAVDSEQSESQSTQTGDDSTSVGSNSSAGGTSSDATSSEGQPSDPCAARTGYRNLFTELLGKTQAEVDAKVAAGYEQMFHGGTDKTVYYEVGDDEAYIHDVNNNDVRSEGMSYGMTISVLLDHKEEYDRLWRWSRERMYESSGQYAGYFSWSTTTQGQITGGPSAPDGEEYFATALILASKKWGDGEGIFNYSQEAKNLLAALTSKGNFNAQEYLVKFVPTSNYSDPSYVLPAFYELWACFDPATRDFWKNAASVGREFLQKTTHPTTGLAPYLANFDGSPYSGGPNFNSDSWRVVGNIMMDHYLFGVDPWQPTFAEKYAAFFVEHQIQPQQMMAYEFSLSGNPMVRGDNVIEGLVAQNAFVAFGTSPEVGTPYVQQLWDLAVPTGVYRYYDGMLYLFGMLHLSGKFRFE